MPYDSLFFIEYKHGSLLKRFKFAELQLIVKKNLIFREEDRFHNKYKLRWENALGNVKAKSAVKRHGTRISTDDAKNRVAAIYGNCFPSVNAMNFLSRQKPEQCKHG